MSCRKDTRRGRKNKTHCFSENDEKYFFIQTLVIEGFIAATPAQSNGSQEPRCLISAVRTSQARLWAYGQRSECLPCGSAATRPCAARDSGKGAPRRLAPKTFPKQWPNMAALAAVNLEAIVLYLG
jgi:hypothetical protein